MTISYPSTFEYEVVTVDSQGKVRERQKCQAEYWTEALGKRVDLELVMIPRGRFQMGSIEGEGKEFERPQHLVTVESFWMGKYPVTQAQWKAVADFPKVKRDLDPDPSRFKGDNLPVERIAWYDAREFCQRLSQKTGREYRLPSESEWEYACRAGTTTPFHFGPTLTTNLVKYNNRYKGTTKVGKFGLANAFGLYDMYGNVWEWCLDCWRDSYQDAPSDGSAWIAEGNDSGGFRKSWRTWLKFLIVYWRKQSLHQNKKPNASDNSLRLRRGGSWILNRKLCRSAFRYWLDPSSLNDSIGFLVVCTTPRNLS